MRLLIIYLLCLPCIGITQFQDDFSDGDFSTQPTWQGDVDKFIVNSEQQLQLNDAEADSPAVLFSQVTIVNAMSWEFYFKQDFKPSANNFARVYLSVDTDNLSSSDLNGYYLKLGGISGDADALELYRQTGDEHLLLASGRDSLLGDKPNQARIKVIRDNSGKWEILADYAGGTNFQLEATASDNMHPRGISFGIACKYSSTRSEDFFFDDFLISSSFEDTEAPKLLGINALDENHIEVQFDEPLDVITAAIPSNYELSPTIGIADVAVNNSKVVLELTEPLVNGTTYTLEVQLIIDSQGNMASGLSADFIYLQIEEVAIGDLIINELFIDPSPSIGLPEAEFIELYNHSDKTLNLEGFILADLSDDVVLPDYILPPKTYVVLQKVGTADFSAFGNTIFIDGLLSLGNQRDEIALIAPTGELLDVVAYNSSWYQNSDKTNGGWTLERINAAAACSRTSSNWIASNDIRGGTPAQQNSVYEPSADTEFLSIQNSFLIAADRLRITFEEALNEKSATTLENYQIEGLQIMDVELEMPLQTSILIRFEQAAEAGRTYTLTIQNAVSDCLGNSAIVPLEVVFALPSLAAANDLVINELLFNPQSGGSDFVELYNRSDKILDLKSLFLANRIDRKLENITPISLLQSVFPADYVVLTPEAADIKKRYTVNAPNQVLEQELPKLPDDKGNLVLYRVENGEAIIIDEFDYTDDLHSPILDVEDGVSLERIHPAAPSNISSSWHSAAATVGFATPTYQNSQYLEPNSNTDESGFSLPESTFSPNGDGYRDFLLVNYELEQVIANVKIFDDQGHSVRQLAYNDLFASQGVFTWDGRMDNGNLAPTGIYILHMEYFDSNGNRGFYQTTCVLAGSF